MSENNILALHAHIDTASADCDGPMYREYTVFLTDEEKAASIAADGVNDFTDIEFRNRILTSQVSVYAVEYGVTMKADSDGFEWHEQTDEGYRSGQVRWCHDESCSESYSQRDIYAEMMGY